MPVKVFHCVGVLFVTLLSCKENVNSRKTEPETPVLADPKDSRTQDPKDSRTQDPKTTHQPDSLVETQLRESTIGKLVLGKNQEVVLSEWNESIPLEASGWNQLIQEDSTKVSGLLIPFSLAPHFTSLESPRIVMTPAEGSAERGRLFVAISGHGEESVVEFISWNATRGAFDFGTVEQHPNGRKLSLAHEPTCFACHRTRSPIFPTETWDNSVVNRSVFAAFIYTQAEIDHPQLSSLNDEVAAMVERDAQARLLSPARMNDFIDFQLQDSPELSAAIYAGFPFVDADFSQAFDFNQAIFEAHALVVASDWLKTLPDQNAASLIANEGSYDLVMNYPDHYKSLATYKSPYLHNFNIIAGEVNENSSLMDVIPNPANINAVHAYNENAKQQQKQIIPDSFRPTSEQAFQEELSDWRDYLDSSVLRQLYKKGDPRFIPHSESETYTSENLIAHDQLCRSCHNGKKNTPNPDFSQFNPLIEAHWEMRFETSPDQTSELACLTLERILSTTSPMPPVDSNAEHSFKTYRDSAVLSLKTFVKRHNLECDI